jgi:hypothetical protein
LAASRDALTKDKGELIAARDAEAKAKAEALAQRDAEAKAKAEALKQLELSTQQQAKVVQEQQQESELLLLQLHQVQEELEHYFLQHQQVSQDKQLLDRRWNKLLQRYPEYAEWDRIDIVPPSEEPVEGAKKPQIRCRIHGLRAGGRHAALMDLTLDVVGKRPVLVLTPPDQGGDNPLIYWPSSPAEDGSKALAPLVLDPTAPAGSEAATLLLSLTPSDLQLVRAACAAMADGLPTTLPDRSLWVQIVSRLRQQLADLAPAWRFDTVQLKHQQVNPDYEHLWFGLTNASFGARQWPNFEFRLSAANIKKGKFSQHPKLEFPLQEGGAHQFENWFEESDDDRGPKYEIRFDAKSHGLDLGAWKALSATDQAQALSLVAQLPLLLQRLQTQGTPISRPWQDWQGMATAIQQSFAHCLGKPATELLAA